MTGSFPPHPSPDHQDVLSKGDSEGLLDENYGDHSTTESKHGDGQERGGKGNLIMCRGGERNKEHEKDTG